MKRLLLSVCLLLGLSAAATAAPVWVQGVGCNSTLGNLVTQYKCRLPNVVGSGNTLIVGVDNNSGASPSSVTDDKGNTYVSIAAKAAGQQLNIYCVTNVTNGPQILQVNYGGAGKNFVSYHVAEFYNVTSCTPTVTVTTNSGTGTSVTAGSFSPASGDLIVNYALQDATTPIDSWTSGTGFTFSTARDLDLSDAIQYRTAAGGAINPTMTMSASKTWQSAAVSLPAGTQGTAPSGFRIQRIQYDNIQSTVSTSPHFVQFPCSGNLIILGWQGSPGRHITGITDSASNTWANSNTGTGYVENLNSGVAQIWYVTNATCANTLLLTVTFDGGDCSAGCAIHLFDAASAATSAFDLEANATGTAVVPSFVGQTITPSLSTALLINVLAVQSNTIISSSPAFFLTPTTTPETSPWPVGENNGLALTYAASGAQQQTWTSDVVAAQWAEENASFKSGAVPAPTLTSISPTSGAQNTTVTVHFVGTNFDQANLAVQVSGTLVTPGSPYNISALAFDSDFVIGLAAAQTARNVTASTDGGTTGAKTFTVTAAAGGGGVCTSFILMGVGGCR